jgi:hypothetical protein
MGEPTTAERGATAGSGGITLRQAWERYRDAHMVRKGRSERTIESYRDHVERIFAEWLDSPLQELGLGPAKVVTKHDDITKENGPYIANGSMRTFARHLQSRSQIQQVITGRQSRQCD